MRITTGLVPIILVLLVSTRAATADKPYASAGVVSLGGTAEFAHSSQTDTPDGADEGADTGITNLELEPTIGYFVIPRLELFGGLLFSMNKQSPDEGDDLTTTAFGLQGGAGYYVPAGSVFLGPRASFAYARGTSELGDDESTASGFQVEGAGALRVPFGWGGLLDVAAVLQYASLGVEVNDNTIGDRSGIRFGLELGFFVFF